MITVDCLWSLWTVYGHCRLSTVIRADCLWSLRTDLGHSRLSALIARDGECRAEGGTGPPWAFPAESFLSVGAIRPQGALFARHH